MDIFLSICLSGYCFNGIGVDSCLLKIIVVDGGLMELIMHDRRKLPGLKHVRHPDNNIIYYQLVYSISVIMENSLKNECKLMTGLFTTLNYSSEMDGSDQIVAAKLAPPGIRINIITEKSIKIEIIIDMVGEGRELPTEVAETIINFSEQLSHHLRKPPVNEKSGLIIQYKALVEKYYKKEHQVKFYADILNKSPKTICNLFAKCNCKSPSSVIQERILTEAKFLLYSTNKSSKEISHELGFEEASHFSRFFKNLLHMNPSDFRKSQLLTA